MSGTVADSGQAAAFFDVDGTLVDSTIVHYYMYFRKRLMGRWTAPAWQTAYYLRCIYYLILDRANRSRMNVVFYRDYAGMDADVVRALAEDCYRDLIVPKLFPDGAACVAQHQQAGRRVVFVTGSLDFIMTPLARALGVDDVIAAEMIERDGLLTGNLSGPPIGETVKADRIRAFATEHGIDLAGSYAYGDSMADVPMLECVGNPHVVNPGGALASRARIGKWPVHQWSTVGATATPASAR